MLPFLPSAWSFATLGSKRTAMELVMAEGKRIKGEGDIFGVKTRLHIRKERI